MSFAKNAIQEAIRDQAVKVVGLPAGFVWNFGNQPGDIPAGEYGTILITDHEAIGFVELERVSESDLTQVTERLLETFEIDVSIQAYGHSATDLVAALKTHFRRPSVDIGTPDTVRLGFMSAGPVRDLSQVIGAVNEHRAQADFRFSARFCSDFVIDAIASVEIHGAESRQTVNLETP